MNKKLLLLSIVALALIVGAGTVLAQGPLVYLSGYQIQNLEDTEAEVIVEYYDQTDGELEASGTITVTASGSKTLFPFITDGISGPETFNGSAVLMSSNKIAAILNTLGEDTDTGFYYTAATNGFSEGAMNVSLPLIACNNAGLDTWFNIQNAGSGDAEVTVTYIPGANGVAGFSDEAVIKEGAAKTFDQRADSTTGTTDCDDLGDPSFVGSALVTSDKPIVASVMYLGTGNIRSFQGYNGFTQGSTSANLPLIMSYNSGYYSGIQIQNAGDMTTTVTVTFNENTLGTGTPNPETFALGAGASKTLIQYGGISEFSPSNDWATDFADGYVAGATVTQTGSEELVAIVNQNNENDTSLGTAYEGFAPTTSTAINIPLVVANNNGYLTGFQIMALEDDTDITIDYTTNTGTGSLEEPVNDSKDGVDQFETWTIIQTGNDPVLSGNNDWTTAGQYIGSARVTANNPIIAIINYTGPSGGDNFSTYNGFNE